MLQTEPLDHQLYNVIKWRWSWLCFCFRPIILVDVKTCWNGNLQISILSTLNFSLQTVQEEKGQYLAHSEKHVLQTFMSLTNIMLIATEKIPVVEFEPVNVGFEIQCFDLWTRELIYWQCESVTQWLMAGGTLVTIVLLHCWNTFVAGSPSICHQTNQYNYDHLSIPTCLKVSQVSVWLSQLCFPKYGVFDSAICVWLDI